MDFAYKGRPVQTTVVPTGAAWGATGAHQVELAHERMNGGQAKGARWIVQKYGGTSVGKTPKGIAEIVAVGTQGEDRIAIVCSARSSNTKNEGTTNRLLLAAKDAENPDSKHFHCIVDTIRDDHVKAAEEFISSREIKDELIKDIHAECDNLVKILESVQHLEEVSSRGEDRIVSKGEKLSCRFMTAILQDNNVKATYVDLSDIMRPSSSNSHHQIDEAFYLRVSKSLAEKVAECEGTVPVITGYFGNIPGGLMNTIGRGYTDLCAALVAVGLQAQELQIWKEVDGIFTADPRKVPTSRLIATVTPSEAAELTFYGSEVIHPFTMEQVIRAKIPIRLKNVMNPRVPGTMIYPDPEEEANSQKLLEEGRIIRSRSPANGLTKLQRPKRPTAVTVKHGIVILNVHSNKRTRSHGFLMRIFSILDKWHLTVDLISSSEVHVSMALHSETAMVTDNTHKHEEGTTNGVAAPGEAMGEADLSIRDDDLWGAVNELKEFGTIDLVNNMAIVSLVGQQLRNMVGISGRLFSTLGDNNINIEMISQGASEINISCVIDDRDADRALNVVHTSLFTFLDA